MARRCNGEGSIRKRKDGRWEGRYYDKLDNNKQKSVYGSTQVEVVKKIQYAQCMQGNKKYIQNHDILMEVWMQIWIDNYTSHLKPLTVSSYRTIIQNHLKPCFGDMRLRDLTTEMIQNMYNQKKMKLSAKTVNNIHGCLHKCLKQAIDLHNGYLDINPADGCSLPRIEEFEIEPLENEDIQDLLKTVSISNIYHQISLFGLFTGMRQSEILGLRWRDVDLKYGTATIKRQLQKDRIVHEEYNSKYFIGMSPKGNRSRTIDLADFVIDILKLRKQQQNEDREVNIDNWVGNTKLNHDLIFTHPNGDHLVHNTVLINHKRLLRESNLSESRFHDLRHSYAVISLQIGEDIKTVQMNMGHKSEAFMLKKYGHMTRGMRRESARRMQSFINSQSNTQSQELCQSREENTTADIKDSLILIKY